MEALWELMKRESKEYISYRGLEWLREREREREANRCDWRGLAYDA